MCCSTFRKLVSIAISLFNFANVDSIDPVWYIKNKILYNQFSFEVPYRGYIESTLAKLNREIEMKSNLRKVGQHISFED